MKKLLLVWLVLVSGLGSCAYVRMARHGTPDSTDNQIFPARALQPAAIPFTFPVASQNIFINAAALKGRDRTNFEEYLKSHNTVAFLILRNDSILYENYFYGYGKDSQIPSFSVAKAFTSALIGFALQDGLIKSVDEPVTNYLPEMKKNGFEKVTIKHLLQMTSGIKFRESDGNPFHEDAQFYYGQNLRQKSLNLKLARTPGLKFEYASGNTQLLALILERSLKGKTVTAYLQEKLWSPLGMESAASWSLDEKTGGVEKAFCCLNATARDFAKFGSLYLNQGRWNGQQLLPVSWVKESTTPDTTQGGADYYKYQWWLASKGNDYLAEGILNQYIYINLAQKLVMVKLSKGYGVWNKWTFFRDIAQQL
ncbi:serine hydrolase [Rufibacter sp. LB8]|uniref:serine hydrolase domain-containing protein n=1 Tax=Rufibacter sp. LB8 TaxID=2777781 RepID=UPI00178C71F9|nr:serine hydrolase [Rufibacter sp. LB8]